MVFSGRSGSTITDEEVLKTAQGHEGVLLEHTQSFQTSIESKNETYETFEKLKTEKTDNTTTLAKIEDLVRNPEATRNAIMNKRAEQIAFVQRFEIADGSGLEAIYDSLADLQRD